MLTKQAFVALMASMPEATDDEIIASALAQGVGQTETSVGPKPASLTPMKPVPAHETAKPDVLKPATSQSVQSRAFDAPFPKYTPEQALVETHRLHTKNGGSTFNLFKGNLLGSENFAVGAYPERGKEIKGPLKPKDLQDFIKANGDLLAKPENSLGTYTDPSSGTTYLDITLTTPNDKEAEFKGVKGKQESIFDLKSSTTIPVFSPTHKKQ